MYSTSRPGTFWVPETRGTPPAPTFLLEHFFYRLPQQAYRGIRQRSELAGEREELTAIQTYVDLPVGYVPQTAFPDRRNIKHHPSLPVAYLLRYGTWYNTGGLPGTIEATGTVPVGYGMVLQVRPLAISCSW